MRRYRGDTVEESWDNMSGPKKKITNRKNVGKTKKRERTGLGGG